MAHEELLNKLGHLNQRNLCLEIGYEKDSPTRDAEELKAETKEFLKEYESHGHTIPPCIRADPIEARLCATNFLVEEGRGERLFPPNPDGAVVWPTDRALIIEAVTHLFRLRAFNNKQLKDQKARKDREIEESTIATQKRSRRSTEHATQLHNNRPYKREPTESSPDLPLPTNLNALDQAHYLKPWHGDPERFNRRAAISHIKELNPLKRQEVIPELTYEWLSKDLPLPPSANPIVAQFMHRRNFYVASDLKLGTFREVVDMLKSNTELTSLSRPQYSKLERRVGERIKELTAEFYTGCFLESEKDGSSKRSKRFQQLWESREEHWKVDREATAPGEDGHKSKRRRRNTKTPAAAPKSPIVFPNISMPQVKIRDDLKSMAGSVLEHLNIGAQNGEPIEEYVVITPKVSPLPSPSRTPLTAPEPIPDLFSLDSTQRPHVPVQAEARPPTTLPLLAPAPPATHDPIPKAEYGVLSKPSDAIGSGCPSRISPKEPTDIEHHKDVPMPEPSPELNHSALNSSNPQNASESHQHSPYFPKNLDQTVPDHLSPPNQIKSPLSESKPLTSSLTEHPRTAITQPPLTPDKSAEYLPELKDDYEIWRASSGLYQMCLKHGLKEFPSLSEEVQTELWGLELWLHPDTTSEFTLRNFCSKHKIPGGIAQYKEWWSLQNETERDKRLHPYHHHAPLNLSQNTSHNVVSQNGPISDKSPTIRSDSRDPTAGFHALRMEASEVPPLIQQPMMERPLEHHHHFVPHSLPRNVVLLEDAFLNGSEPQISHAKLEEEAQKLQILCQNPGGIPQFDSELDLGLFLRAHNISEKGYQYWEERYCKKRQQPVNCRSPTRENISYFHEEPRFPHSQKPMSPKINHSQGSPKHFASPLEWANVTQQQLAANQKPNPNIIPHPQNPTVNVARNLLPKTQGFTPVQPFPPDNNHTGGVKLNFTPITQPRTFVAERKNTKRRARRAPHPYGAEQLRGPNRKTTQFPISPNSDRAWREIVDIPDFQPNRQAPSQQHIAFPSHHQITHNHTHPNNNAQYMPPINSSPQVNHNTFPIGPSNPIPTSNFAISPTTPPKADPITPSRTPSPNKPPELGHRSYSQEPRSIHTSTLPQTTPELKSSPHLQDSPTPSQTYPPTPSTAGPSPFPTSSNASTIISSSKTLDFIFQLPTKDLDFDSPIPFPSLEKLSLDAFFSLFAEKTEAKLDALEKVTMTPAFGNQQSFMVQRFGDGATGKWEKVKGRLKTMWIQQVKREPEKDDFEIWVEVEG